MSNELRKAELTRLCKAGNDCHIIGLDVSNMDRVELVAAIGYMNEYIVSTYCGDEKFGFTKGSQFKCFEVTKEGLGADQNA